MARYEYEARDQTTGKKTNGIMEAPNGEYVFEKLITQSLIPISVKKEMTKNGLKLSHLNARSIKQSQLTLALKSLSMLLNAGLMLDKACQSVADQFATHRIGKHFKNIVTALREGDSFSEALSKYPNIFPQTMIQLVRTGELTGQLSTVLNDYITQREKIDKIKTRIQSALIYPSILFITIIITIWIILGYVVPQFEPIFARLQTALPWSTAFVLSLSDLFSENFWMICLGSSLSIACLITTSKIMFIRLFWHTIALKLFLDLILKIEISRFSLILGSLLKRDTDIVTALPVAIDGLKNLILKQAMHKIQQQILEGTALSHALKTKKHLFPHLMIQLIEVGEQTGTLGDVLLKISEIYDHNVETTLNRFVSLLVPILTLIMGGGVAFISVAILSGIMTVNALIM